ncbi:phosphatidate cytidylyltransferase [Bacteroidia bacterium]|nr:phosphatidate cytidylyltransferase [Bacteroidia bacterium]MDB9882045.1 phosphatidate cytidylyltransferase [Bacteroidia bacterium]
MSNFSLRVIFGAIYVAIMILAAVFETPYFGVLMALLAFLSINEMAVLAKKDSSQHLWINPAVFAGIILYITFVGARDLSLNAYLIAFVAQLGCMYISYINLKDRSSINYVSTTLYLWLPLGLLAVWFLQNPSLNTEYVLFYFATVWLYDSMAYLVGKSIGKTPIFPKVSPKKTIEGTVGGAIFTILIMSVLNHLCFHLPIMGYMVVSIIVLFATFGDFVESYMKRKVGAKDSGNLIPGHGGILDRIDSIYLSALPYLVILLLQ